MPEEIGWIRAACGILARCRNVLIDDILERKRILLHCMCEDEGSEFALQVESGQLPVDGRGDGYIPPETAVCHHLSGALAAYQRIQGYHLLRWRDASATLLFLQSDNGIVRPFSNLALLHMA
uniref:Bm12722 n=1 Tax=Brugia malayi TaxID=6279 RepID=A0A1I9GBT6_BRUMA|nr:Bm12722 [Brugia malayi]